MMKRTSKEIKRKIKVMKAFPNQQSLLRLLVLIMIDINEKLITGNRDRLMEQYFMGISRIIIA